MLIHHTEEVDLPISQLISQVMTYPTEEVDLPISQLINQVMAHHAEHLVMLLWLNLSGSSISQDAAVEGDLSICQPVASSINQSGCC